MPMTKPVDAVKQQELENFQNLASAVKAARSGVGLTIQSDAIAELLQHASRGGMGNPS